MGSCDVQVAEVCAVGLVHVQVTFVQRGSRGGSYRGEQVCASGQHFLPAEQMEV